MRFLHNIHGLVTMDNLSGQEECISMAEYDHVCAFLATFPSLVTPAG